MDPRTVTAIAGAAEAIHASIQTHKRAQEAHRRQARNLRKALEQLRSECERLGVTLEITQAPGGGSHSDRTSRSLNSR